MPFTLRSGLIWSMNSVVLLPSHAAGQRRSLDGKQPLTGGCGRHQAPSSHFSALPSSAGVPSPGVSTENLPLPRPIKMVVGHHPYQRTHLHRVVFFFLPEVTEFQLIGLVGLELLSGTWADAPGNSGAKSWGEASPNGEKAPVVQRSRRVLCRNKHLTSCLPVRTHHLL